MDENSCVLLPLTTQLKKAEYLECVLCPGMVSPLPAKWWQCLKSSSKAMLWNKHWCKSCEEDPAPASWALFCDFTHHLLSGAACYHRWGQDLGLSTVEGLSPCLWLGWKGCAPAHFCSAYSGSRELCPGYPGRRHHAQLCPAVPCSPLHQGWTHPLQRSMQGIYVLDFPSASCIVSHFRFARETAATATWKFCFMIFTSLFIS